MIQYPILHAIRTMNIRPSLNFAVCEDETLDCVQKFRIANPVGSFLTLGQM